MFKSSLLLGAVLVIAAEAAWAQGGSYLQVYEPDTGALMVQFSLQTESGCQYVRDRMTPDQQRLARCNDTSHEDQLPWKTSVKNEVLGITVKVSAVNRDVCGMLVAQTRRAHPTHPEIITDCSR